MATTIMIQANLPRLAAKAMVRVERREFSAAGGDDDRKDASL